MSDYELDRDGWPTADTVLRQRDAEIKQLKAQLANAEFDLKNASEAMRRFARDAVRLDWVERHLIEGKWDGTIGRPKSWHMIGPYRHTLQAMRGNSLREAIDYAIERQLSKEE